MGSPRMIYNDFLDENELEAYAQAINSRAKQARKEGRISRISLRDRILESGGKCDWCAISILQQSFEIDHLIALSSGGANAAENLAVACPDCNRSKSAKHPARFAQETYARTGIMTPLLRRVLDYYQTEASVQKSLFKMPEEIRPKLIDEPIDDEPPPYIWGK
jgi:hypothetical protein